MTSAAQSAPPLVFSHFGYYVADYDRMVGFWTRVFGFGVSDHGGLRGRQMAFMTRRPFEHHQLVAVGGRDPAHPSTVADVGFLAPDLAELRRIARILPRNPASTASHPWTMAFPGRCISSIPPGCQSA